MSNLEFLEISRNFKSYYQTLRDVHYYLTNDSELTQEDLQAVTKVLSKLIYGFIRIKGTSFREMDLEQFEQEFHLFHQDFLNVIQNSGENNVDFDQFTELMDEIIGIAVKRMIALGKIKKVKHEHLLEDNEIDEVSDAESELSNEDEDIDADDEVVVEVFEVIDEIKEAVPEVVTPRNEVRIFSTDVETLSNEVKTFSTDVETFSTDVKTLSDEVKTFSTDVETLSNEIGNAEVVQPELVSEVVVADVNNKVEGEVEIEVPTVTPKKVKNNYVDAAPVVNNFKNNESGDDFRFRPRRRRK